GFLATVSSFRPVPSSWCRPRRLASLGSRTTCPGVGCSETGHRDRDVASLLWSWHYPANCSVGHGIAGRQSYDRRDVPRPSASGPIGGYSYRSTVAETSDRPEYQGQSKLPTLGPIGGRARPTSSVRAYASQ